MIDVSIDFRRELLRQFRKPGHCKIKFVFYDGTVREIPQTDVKSISFHNIGDPLSRRLPTEDCTFSIFDYSNDFNPMLSGETYEKCKKGVYVYIRIGIGDFGSEYWTNAVSLFIRDVPKYADHIATFSATRTIGMLHRPFRGILDTARALSDVLYDGISELFSEYENDRPIIRDENGVPIGGSTNPIPDVSRRIINCPVSNNVVVQDTTLADVFLMAAFATGTSLRTKYGNGVIEVLEHYRNRGSDNVDENIAIIRSSDMLSDPKLEISPEIREVKVKYHYDTIGLPDTVEAFSIDGSSGFLPDPTSEAPMIIKFKQPIQRNSLVLNFENVDASSFSYRVYGSEIAIFRIVRQDATRPYRVTGQGYAIASEEREWIYSENKGTEFEEITNPFINERTTSYVARSRHDYLASTRELYEFEYRGDPTIEHLDIIQVELPFVGFVPCIVLESTFELSSGFSGKLKVRRLKGIIGQNRTCAVSDFAISDFAVSDSEQ